MRVTMFHSNGLFETGYQFPYLSRCENRGGEEFFLRAVPSLQGVGAAFFLFGVDVVKGHGFALFVVGVVRNKGTLKRHRPRRRFRRCLPLGVPAVLFSGKV